MPATRTEGAAFSSSARGSLPSKSGKRRSPYFSGDGDIPTVRYWKGASVNPNPRSGKVAPSRWEDPTDVRQEGERTLSSRLRGRCIGGGERGGGEAASLSPTELGAVNFGGQLVSDASGATRSREGSLYHILHRQSTTD